MMTSAVISGQGLSLMFFERRDDTCFNRDPTSGYNQSPHYKLLRNVFDKGFPSVQMHSIFTDPSRHCNFNCTTNERTLRPLTVYRVLITGVFYVYASSSTRCFFACRLAFLLASMLSRRFFAERRINLRNL